MTDKEKSVPDLEKEKLEIEIKLLKQNLEKEKKESKGKKNIGEISRKNLTLLLAIISVVGGFIGIILPVNQYFTEKKKQMLPELNSDIIKLVGQLNSSNDTTQEDAAVMLTYYGRDAIPILLLKLERSTPPETERLIHTIKSIHEEEPLAVMNEIRDAFRAEVEKNYSEASIDDMSYETRIYNYIDLLMNLELSWRQKRKLKSLCADFEEGIPIAASDEFKETFVNDLNYLCNHFNIDSVKFDN